MNLKKTSLSVLVVVLSLGLSSPCTCPSESSSQDGSAWYCVTQNGELHESNQYPISTDKCYKIR